MTMEVAFPTSRLKTLEKQREVEPDTCTYLRNDRHSTRGNITEMRIIRGAPNKEFADIKKVDKDTRGDTQLIRAKAKKSMMTKNNRAHRRETEHKGLKPRQNTLSKRTLEKQVLQRLYRGTTKTR